MNHKYIVHKEQLIQNIDYLRNINRLNLEYIQLYENGKLVEFTKEEIKKWSFFGLNNTDFLSGEFKEETNNEQKQNG